MARKRYAQVGMGGRSWMYTKALVDGFAEHAQLVGICDRNAGRLKLAADRIAAAGGGDVPAYPAEQFEQMVARTKPDVVVITTGPDVTHADYACRAMELGCDVISEKPMTVSADLCRRILAARQRTGRSLRVTFNYRYSPPRSQVKRLLDAGAIGEVLSVDFTWMLDTRHGADYFRRWHRRRENSGSLLVHKATHHFDLVNWWLGDRPADVFARGRRAFYTPRTADALGLKRRGERCHGCPEAAACPFYLDLAASAGLRTLYLDCEQYDGYFRDRCVFAEEIDIWDHMALNVRYRRGALLNYMLTAHSPWEGYRIAFNGTTGRLEHQACENTYINGDGSVPGELEKGKVSITLIEQFSRPRQIEVEVGAGGHGGGDPVLLADLLHPAPPADPLNRRADHRDGTYSIMIGIAAAASIDSGEVVAIDDLLGDAPV
ncbi:MAG: Gfo/Idh/MocA family oxidoreductase [Planctomycetes bacterium]|nr:Gfo/Idh/MocA family oxidoreductase [Planctomycetota bacterium]